MDVELSLEMIRMRKEVALIIQGFTNLGHGKVYGLKVGHVAGDHGTQWDVEKAIIKEHQRMLLSNFV